MAELFGAKWLCCFAIAISAVMNFITPLFARWNYYVLIGSRILLGLGQSAIYPSFYAIFVRWIPENERSTFLSWLDAGTCFGAIIAMGMSGILSRSHIFGGWPAVFYFSGREKNYFILCPGLISVTFYSGFAAVAWVVLWIIFTTSDPRSHPWISEKELEYIKMNAGNAHRSKQDRKSVPWRRILTSKSFLSVLAVKVLLGWGSGMTLLKLPAYLNSVLNFPIDQVKL